MTSAYRIGGFLAAMAAVFGIAFGVGRAVDPWDGQAPPQQPTVHQQHTE